MRTIIMAAGTSQRLRPLTNDIPKTLLQLGEKQILEHILDSAVENGLTHFDIVTGHGHSAVEEFANDYQQRHPRININLIFNDEFDSTGNVVSLYAAKEVFDEDFIIINSDTIFHANVLKRLVESEHANAMMIDDIKKLGEEEMKIIKDEEENIIRIHKSVDPNGSHGEYVGIMKLSKEIKEELLHSLDTIINQDNSLYYEDAIQHLAQKQGIVIKHISTAGLPVMEIDTHEDLKDAESLIKKI